MTEKIEELSQAQRENKVKEATQLLTFFMFGAVASGRLPKDAIDDAKVSAEILKCEHDKLNAQFGVKATFEPL